MKNIDINCDVGEGVENEHLLMPFISSCNIACGGHYGDEISIDKTIQLAIKNNVKIGAHPSFPDKENFGRKILRISDENLKISIQNQMDLFLERLSLQKKKLHHIKPHGALYNALTVDEKLAKTFVKTTQKYLNEAFLFVPYNSIIAKIALKSNIKVKYEAFADRNYNDDLTLVSRNNKNAVLVDKMEIFNRVLWMLKNDSIKTVSKVVKFIKTDTFCVHSDTENAIEIVKYLYQNLEKSGYNVG